MSLYSNIINTANDKILIFGGTGSLGKTLVKRFLKDFKFSTLTVFSRDEAKHFRMKSDFPDVEYIIGDVRNYDSVYKAMVDTSCNIIINAAAMKQVPTCEDCPYEAVLTNIMGTKNVVKAVENLHDKIHTKVLSISTDKACKPVNSYGMTKALQERIHLSGKSAIYNCARYGNVLESTGSVIPFFKELISKNIPLTVTHSNMTRFFMSLNEAVDLIMLALHDNHGKKIFIPQIKSGYVSHLAEILCEHYKFYDENSKPKIRFSKIRPGEKMDEILISEEELWRTECKEGHYVIRDIKETVDELQICQEYSSRDVGNLLSKEQLKEFLIHHGVIS